MRHPRRRLVNPAADAQRAGLRVLGGILVAVGGVCAILGFTSFFGAFGRGSGPPSYFWLAFLGLPLLGIGVMLLKFGYVGAIARYVAGEGAPVATDTVRYIVDETRDSLRGAAGAVGAGLRGEAGPARGVACACGAANDADAHFCDQCGKAMPRPRVCPACAAENDANARFCSACGGRLGAGT